MDMTPRARRINEQEREYLDLLLWRKGLNWARLCRVAQWKPGPGPEAMHLTAYAWAVDYLKGLPDA